MTLPSKTASPEPLRIHLGCGQKFIEGFTHIDLADYPHITHKHDVRDLHFIDDGTAELVYASHVLEHFGRHEFRSVLREWLRVLKVGGVLRLSVPDFSACAALYYEDGLSDGLSGLIGLVCGGQRNEYDFHKMIFDEEFLTRELLSLGCSAVRRWDWRSTTHSKLDDYSQAYIPHMDKEHGRMMSLNLEAVK